MTMGAKISVISNSIKESITAFFKLFCNIMEDRLAALRRKLKATIEEEASLREEIALLSAEIAAAKSDVAAVLRWSDSPTPPLEHHGDEEMLVLNTIAQGLIVEGPQPIKVVSVENARTVGIQASDEPPPSRFTLTIENFSRLVVKKLYSETFTAGGYKWRVLIFPKGNNVDFLSMYLDVAESSSLPNGWNTFANFSLTVVSQRNDKLTMEKYTYHQFNQRESDWGFTSFMPLSDLYDPNRGYLVNDTCVIQAEVVNQIPHLYSIIEVQVARDEDLREQIGKDFYFDLIDHDKVRNFQIPKLMPFNHFKEAVAKEFGIPVQFQRFWIWAKRQNHTYRPYRPLTTNEEAQTVESLGTLRDASNKAHNAVLKLFLEVEFGLDLLPIRPVEKNKDDILLFFKLYDPEKEELRYVGKLFVKNSAKPIEIQAKLNVMAGFAPNEEIEFFEEIKFEPAVMCERLDKRASFRFSLIEDGDIVCFQKWPPTDQIRFPEVSSFLEYVQNRQGEAPLLEKQIPPSDKVKDDEARLLEKEIPLANKVSGGAPVAWAHAARAWAHAARVTISCPQEGDFAGKLVLLPHSFEKLLELGKKKYGLLATKVLTTNGAEIDCVDVIRDGDHLVFASSGSIL